jgi:hypothetical protein
MLSRLSRLTDSANNISRYDLNWRITRSSAFPEILRVAKIHFVVKLRVARQTSNLVFSVVCGASYTTSVSLPPVAVTCHENMPAQHDNG